MVDSHQACSQSVDEVAYAPWQRHRSRATGVSVRADEGSAYRAGYIDAAQLEKLAHAMGSSAYGAYLLGLLRERE